MGYNNENEKKEYLFEFVIFKSKNFILKSLNNSANSNKISDNKLIGTF